MAKKEAENQDIVQINIRNVPAPVAAKFKVLAATHGDTQNDIYIQALEKFIELYEKKNGVIKTVVKKKSINL